MNGEMIDRAVKNVTSTMRPVMEELVTKTYSEIIDFIQMKSFNEDLDDGQKKVLREVMDFCIAQKREVPKGAAS